MNDTDWDSMIPEACPAGIHADWAHASDDDRPRACPWCRITELEASHARALELADETKLALLDERNRALVAGKAELDLALAERDQARQIARDMLATVLMATPGHRLTIIGAENRLPDWLTEQDPA